MKVRIIVILILGVFTDLKAVGQSKAEIDSALATDYQSILANPNSYITIFNKAKKDAFRIDYKKGAAKALGHLGMAFYMTGQLDSASKSYLNCIDIYESINDEFSACGIYAELGYSLKRHDVDKAKLYMRKGIEIADRLNMYDHLVNHYNNFGVIHEIDGDLDSAAHYYLLSLKYAKQINDPTGIPYAYNNLAGVYSMNNLHDKAFIYLGKSDSIRENDTSLFVIGENLALRGDLWYRKAGYDSAVHYYRKSLNSAKRIRYSYLVKHCSDYLSKSFEEMNIADSALYYFKQLTAYNDSLEGVEITTNMARIETEFQTERKERELAETNLELRNSQLKTVVIGFISFLMLILAVIIWRVQVSKRQKQRMKSEQDMLEEKSRISKELHDNIGSQLTFMISSIENSAFGAENEQKERLDQIGNFGRETLDDLRNTVWAMKQSEGKLDLLLEKLTELRIKLSGVVDLDVTSDIDTFLLNASEMLNIYRIIQEFTQNAVKHGGSNKVSIHFKSSGSGLLVAAKDHGKGFDPANVTNGSGLSNMANRAGQINAKYKLDSKTINGVTLTLEIIR